MRKLSLLACFFCTLSLFSQVTIFPADANNDGRADQYDILPIGVAFGAEGFPRPGASLAWFPQFHPMQWGQGLPVSGIDLAFVDSDGNGFIDSVDIDAIALNFDSTQAASQPPPQPYLLPDTCFSCPKPILFITFDRDTAMVNDTFLASIMLQYPPNVPPQAGALGIAFELRYDPENIRDSLTKIFPDTMPGDLMFVTATNTLAKPWRSLQPGTIGFGAAGKGANALFVPRIIGVVEIVVEDMIIRTPSVAVEFWMEIEKVLIVNELEQVVCLGDVVVDTLVLFDPLNPAGEIEVEVEVDVFPNPSQGMVGLRCANAAIEGVKVFDPTGRELYRVIWPPATEQWLHWQHLPPGPYFLKIKTQGGEALRVAIKSSF